MFWRLLILALITGPVIADQGPAQPHITVFIHGTVGSILHMPVLHHILQDKEISTHPALCIQQLFREHPLFEIDQLGSVKLGLHKLEHAFLKEFDASKLTPENQKRAWYHLLAAFEHCIGIVDDKTRTSEYCLFGWSGILSNCARRKAGLELYEALVKLQSDYELQHGVKPTIDIIGHSHGGNVALWLSHYEQEYKQGLSINTLCLLGTPLQKETRDALTSPFFPAIISFYSKGDYVHARDYVSTKDRKSHYRLRDSSNIKEFLTHNPNKIRLDVKLVVGGNDKCIDHANLYLTHRGNVIFKELSSYPYVVYLPLVVHHVKDHSNTQERLIMHMELNQKHLTTSLRTHFNRKTQLLSVKKHALHALHELHEKSAQVWKPFEKGRQQIFNKKNARMIWDAFKLRFGAQPSDTSPK